MCFSSGQTQLKIAYSLSQVFIIFMLNTRLPISITMLVSIILRNLLAAKVMKTRTKYITFGFNQFNVKNWIKVWPLNLFKIVKKYVWILLIMQTLDPRHLKDMKISQILLFIAPYTPVGFLLWWNSTITCNIALQHIFCHEKVNILATFHSRYLSMSVGNTPLQCILSTNLVNKTL